MKYRIVNIEYWKQFSRMGEPMMYEKIRDWKNDEVHILDDRTAQHGLLWNCISVASEKDVAMEDIVTQKEEVEEKEVEEEFKCDICGKVCKNKLGLNAHKRSHK